MGVFAWSDKYSVNIPSFDAQHQKLFALIHQLQEAMLVGHGKDVLGGLLDELIQYTSGHFAAEEQAMTAHNFPGRPGHKLEHDKLTAQVLDFQTNFRAGNTMLSVSLMTFLQDWLTTHILVTDKNYTSFLSGKGVT